MGVSVWVIKILPLNARILVAVGVCPFFASVCVCDRVVDVWICVCVWGSSLTGAVSGSPGGTRCSMRVEAPPWPPTQWSCATLHLHGTSALTGHAFNICISFKMSSFIRRPDLQNYRVVSTRSTGG